MKKLEIPVYVPDYFRVPDDCDLLRLECDAHWVEFGRSYYQLKHPNLIAIKKPKPKYDWPDWVKPGVTIEKNAVAGIWRISLANKSNWNRFDTFQRSFDLPDPPADTPVGTIFVKGEE